MLANEELSLLIKSRYPLVYVESIDETYVLDQLRAIARSLRLDIYEWSVTRGLKRHLLKESYPGTEVPAEALRSILNTAPGKSDALYILKDFERFLGDATVMRLLKDLINQIRHTRTTVVIVSAQYNLPPDLEASSAHIVGGYPSEGEIVELINQTLEDFGRDTQSKVDLKLDDRQEDQLIRALKGLTLQQVRNVLYRSLLNSRSVDGSTVARVEQQKKDLLDRDGMLEFCVPEKASAIANFHNLRRWLAERRGSFMTGERESGLPPPRGVLLMGVQGCGKSLAVKVAADELGLPLYRLDLVRCYSKFIGETEQNLRKALKTVEQLAPVCLWIDEIEKAFAASAGDVDGGVSQRLLGTFLTWMQERKQPCFVAATANDVLSLPPEFLRKGRFDEIFFVDLPDEETRLNLFQIHLRKRKLDPANFDCGRLAQRAADFNGAEIEQVVISSLYRADSRRETVTEEHLCVEIQATKPLSVIRKEEVDALRSWARDRTVSA
jgi:hypothetical protein